MLKIILIIVIIMIYLGIGVGISLLVNCDTDYWTKDEFNESFNEFALGVLFWPIISIGLVVYAIIKTIFERNKK